MNQPHLTDVARGRFLAVLDRSRHLGEEDAALAALAAVQPEIAAEALEWAAADIYNADPDPNFVKRQTFYNVGVNPWLMEKARIARTRGTHD